MLVTDRALTSKPAAGADFRSREAERTLALPGSLSPRCDRPCASMIHTWLSRPNAPRTGLSPSGETRKGGSRRGMVRVRRILGRSRRRMPSPVSAPARVTSSPASPLDIRDGAVGRGIADGILHKVVQHALARAGGPWRRVRHVPRRPSPSSRSLRLLACAACFRGCRISGSWMDDDSMWRARMPRGRYLGKLEQVSDRPLRVFQPGTGMVVR